MNGWWLWYDGRSWEKYLTIKSSEDKLKTNKCGKSSGNIKKKKRKKWMKQKNEMSKKQNNQRKERQVAVICHFVCELKVRFPFLSSSACFSVSHLESMSVHLFTMPSYTL